MGPQEMLNKFSSRSARRTAAVTANMTVAAWNIAWAIFIGGTIWPAG